MRVLNSPSLVWAIGTKYGVVEFVRVGRRSGTAKSDALIKVQDLNMLEVSIV